MVGYSYGARRSWLAAAAVLGLVGSLLAVGAAPGGAVAGEADNEAVYSACVGPALESAGLVDVEGSFAEDAVNCVAHYGITRGRTETMYDPGAPVSRWQMALFLSRAASPAGVVLPANPEVGFTDLEGVFEGARTAIAQMANLGIMRGQGSSTSFRPEQPVSRASMAEMLDAFLKKAEEDSGLGLGALGGNVDGLEDVSPDDEVFTDIANVTRGQFAAVRRMFELGVTKGAADGRFNPGALVTRAQMAVFITRMLAHTAARPAGLTVQAESSEATTGESVGLAVSVRDSALMAMPDAVVDVFSAVNPDDAFAGDGRCSDEVSAVGGSKVCEIASGDSSTDPSGDLELSADNLAESSTIWAWTGDVGDVYDADDTEAASVLITVNKPGVKLQVTDDLVEGATAAKFGQRVVFTLQVVDEDGNEAAVEDVSVKVAMAETVVDAGAEPASESTTSSTNTYKTDASGKIELTFRQTDPRAGSGDRGDSARLDLDVTPLGDPALELEDKTNLEMARYEAAAGAAVAAMVWRDSTPEPTSLMLSQDVSYREASDAGSGAAHIAKATLTDQYGDPISRQRIHFTSDDPLGVGEEAEDASLEAVRASVADLPNAPVVWRQFTTGVLTDLIGQARITRTTNARGVATLSYTRKSAASVIETISARLVRGQDDSTIVNRVGFRYDRAPAEGDDPADLISEKLAVYWYDELADRGSASGRILVKDDENNRIVIGASDGRVVMAAYDPNDQFTGIDGPSTLAAFEKDLKDDAAHLAVSGYDDNPKSVSSFTLSPEWSQVDLLPISNSNVVEADTTTHIGIGSYAADGDTIVVGAHTENDYAGAVFVYDGPGDTTPVKLTAPTPQPITDLTVFNNFLPQPRWYYQPWHLNHPESGGWFGYDVDIRGDTIVVGEPGRLTTRQIAHGGNDPRNGNATDGAVYVYTRGSDGAWSLDATLTGNGDGTSPRGTGLGGNADHRHGFEFGRAVAVSGDEKVIAVGASRYMTNTRIGGVYMYDRPASAAEGNWDDDDGQDSARLAPVQSDLSEHRNSWFWNFTFERELDISEDGSTVVAGGNYFNAVVGDVQYQWAGAAYIFTEPAGGWTRAVVTPDAKLVSPNPLPAERVGRTVAVSADGATVVVSANFRPNLLRQGSVLVFERPATGEWEEKPAPTAILRSPDHPDAPDNCTPAGPVLGCNLGEVFGQWVDIIDDGDQILASRSHRTEGDRRGSIHLFTEPSGGWAEVTDEDQPASVEYLGTAPRTGLGWRNTFDQTSGAIYAYATDPDSEGPASSSVGAEGAGANMYRIPPAE